MRTAERKKTPRRLLAYVRPHSRPLALGIASMLVCGLLLSAVPLFIKYWIDEGIVKRNLWLLSALSVSIILVYVVRGVFMFWGSYLIAYVGQKIVEVMRNEVYNRLQWLDLRFFEKRRTGELMSRVTNDVAGVQQFVRVVVDMVNVPIGLITRLGVLLFLSAKLTLITFVCLPFITFLIIAAGRRMKKVSAGMQGKLADISTVLQESLSAIRIVKSFSMEDYEIERFERESRESFLVSMKGERIRALLAPAVEVLGAAGLAFVFWIGGLDVIAKTPDAITGKVITTGDLFAFLMALHQFYDQFKRLNNTYLTMQHSSAAAERLFQVMDMRSEIREKPGAVELPTIRGRVAFRHVDFEYEQGKPVLRDVNLDFDPGTVIALVGPSGAGKTTFVNLIPRFYDVTGGAVLVDGQDVRDVKIASLREQMGIVPQETILFSATVGENVSYGRRGAPAAEIESAARAANAHEFISELPDRYDTMLGERGANLSGGQRQRIAIARAILKDPRILILDEATSNVDSLSEIYIQEALQRLMKGRTTFVIAHRLSTIQNADVIVVLDEGRVVETGRHGDLYEKGGMYRRLYDLTLAREDENRKTRETRAPE
ncbi:MAG: ABC transporter ATP-binding protein [bacterium]